MDSSDRVPEHTVYRAVPCACGCKSCTHWHVAPVADVQCVRFTERQARAVADLLNCMEESP